MGIYDRDYYQESRQPGLSFRKPHTMVGMLILINVVIYVIDAFTPAIYGAKGLIVSHWLSDMMAVRVESLTDPLQWWRFLTYGFAHAPTPQHILFNMLTLWFLGRDVETHYGRYEFLRVYLFLLVVGSVAWAAVNHINGTPGEAMCYGASGAVAGVVILFALNFPRRTLLLFFVLPVPAWLVGVMVVVGDMLGATGHIGGNIAYSVHLAGAMFALLYFQFRWNFGRWISGLRIPRSWFKRRPSLRLHDPDVNVREDYDLSEEVDRILEKISAEGQNSLTRKERRTLEAASKEYQKRRP